MKIGARFNPYKVFQGVFAPYWLLEHRGLGAGAKLCYIRLLGFAGKDARCYPSLETLGTSLGVSERQARDYVKELERSGLIVIEQRGLRKTNVYLFVWTAELEQLLNAVPEDPDDPDGQDGGTSQNASADRNTTSGPIGINSPGISSGESSSSSNIENPGAQPKMMTTPNRESGCPNLPRDAGGKQANRHAQMILDWARDCRLLRLRSDGRTGTPEKEHLALWSEILNGRGIAEENRVFAVMDRARQQADDADRWRNWSFLTLQIQLAAERIALSEPVAAKEPSTSRISADEDPASDRAKFKAKIRTDVGEIPFMNWFEHTRQVDRSGPAITIAVADETTRCYLEEEYRELIDSAMAGTGIETVRFVAEGGV